MKKTFLAAIDFLDLRAMEVFFAVVFVGTLFIAVPAIVDKLATSRDVKHYQVQNNKKSNPCGENGTPLLLGEKAVQCLTKRGNRTGKPIPLTIASAE